MINWVYAESLCFYYKTKNIQIIRKTSVNMSLESYIIYLYSMLTSTLEPKIDDQLTTHKIFLKRNPKKFSSQTLFPPISLHLLFYQKEKAK